MATIINTITNLRTEAISLFVPGLDAEQPRIVVAAGATLDLFSMVSVDEIQAMQKQLNDLVANGVISIVASSDSATIIGYKDNATSLRVSGPDFSGAIVQSYSGVFYNDSYDTNGLLKTRFITGGNENMDLELQSSNALLISAVGENAAGFAKIAARTNVIFNVRDEADQDSPKQLIIDRVDTSTVGAANTSDVNIKSTGNIHINSGVVTGAVVLPLLTDTQRGALTPVKGMLIMNATTSLLNVYDGSAWKAVDVSAV